jgi:peptide/nickel transport system substrate-binding protein
MSETTSKTALMMRRRTVLRLGALAGATVVANGLLACTPSAGPAVVEEPAIPTDKLTIIQDNAIDSLDAHVAQRPQANIIIQRMNEALLEREPQTLQPRARLAVSWRRVDPLVWEFKLRPNVKFTNGEPFNASVVKFNFERAFKPDLKSSKGTSFRTILDATTPVTVIDDLTVQLKTKAPYALLLERLVPFWLVPQKYTLEKGDSAYGLAPIGTGPYTFVEWNQGQSATIKKNPDYWGDKATFETITYRQIAETTTAVAELLAGTADIAYGLTPDTMESVKASGKADVVPYRGVEVIEVRMDPIPRGGPNPFTDKRVRLAANYAVDKEAIAKNLLGGYSTVVATNILPWMFGHDPNVKPYPYDLNKAKQLMAEAGHPNGIDVRFLSYPVSGIPSSLLSPMVQAITNDLSKAGIRASIFNIGATEVSTYTTTGKAGPIFIGGNPNGGFYDGGFGFFFLRQSANLSYFWSNELEQNILKVEQSSDNEERKRILSQIQNYLHDEAPYIWGWTGFSLIGVKKGLDMTNVIVGPDLFVERLKPKKR